MKTRRLGSEDDAPLSAVVNAALKEASFSCHFGREFWNLKAKTPSRKQVTPQSERTRWNQPGRSALEGSARQ